jgi:hypothetical protein
MNFDNKDDYHRLRGQLAVMTILFSTLIAMSALYDHLSEWIYPMGRVFYTSFFGALFLAALLFRSQLKYHFVLYNDDGPKIIIRYYPMRAFTSKYKSVEIPKNTLYKIEVTKSFFNLREELVIYQRVKEGVAKYPAIPISGLSRKHRTMLIDTLNTYAQKS